MGNREMSSELLTPKEIIRAKLWNILASWVGDVSGMQFDKPCGSLREERGIPEVEIKFDYSELLQS